METVLIYSRNFDPRSWVNITEPKLELDDCEAGGLLGKNN